MKAVKFLTGMAVSALAASALAITASADVSGNAGVSFQTERYTYRDCYGADHSKDAEDASCPNGIVGVQGGTYGFSTGVSVSDTAINGAGTYKISIEASGTINSAAQEFDDGTSRDRHKWSMASPDLTPNDDGTTDDDTYFRMITISTDVPSALPLLKATRFDTRPITRLKVRWQAVYTLTHFAEVLFFIHYSQI